MNDIKFGDRVVGYDKIDGKKFIGRYVTTIYYPKENTRHVVLPDGWNDLAEVNNIELIKTTTNEQRSSEHIG